VSDMQLRLWLYAMRRSLRFHQSYFSSFRKYADPLDENHDLYEDARLRLYRALDETWDMQCFVENRPN
jgi:hypothetical protein